LKIIIFCISNQQFPLALLLHYLGQEAEMATRITQHNHKGFTIIEIMVVITIAALLMVMAIPTFRSTMKHFNLTGDLRGLESDLRVAQGLAIKGAVPHQILFDVGVESFKIQRCPPGAACTDVAGTTRLLGALSTSGDNVMRMGTTDVVSVLNSAGVAQTRIQFGSDGMIGVPSTNFPVTVTLMAMGYGNSERIHLQVSRAGRVQVCTADDNDADTDPEC
jgi:type IV fimbrial biogenesis protein FimT